MASPSKSQIDAMLEQAKCFACLGPATLMEIETYVMTQVYDGISPDPSALQHSAKCLQCLSYSTLLRIKAYLLSKINETAKNGSMDLNVLLKEYACYSCIPKGMLLPLETWLLTTDAQAPATKDPSGLAKLAKCFHCLSPETLLEIQVYLLARITGFPIDPDQLAHESNSFQPIEGPAPSWVSVGAVSETLDFGGGGSISCTDVAYQLVPVITAHYDGSGNITTIDVLLPKVCCDPFGWTIYGSNNADMSAAHYVNGALIPPAWGGGNNYSVTGIDVSLAGYSYYAARQRCGDLAESDYSNIVNATSGAEDAEIWADNVVTNGGVRPTDETINDVRDFIDDLITGNIYSKMISVIAFAPDNLTAAITPILYSKGNNPWTNHNFVAGDLNLNGLKGDAATKYLETGINPSTDLSLTSAGITMIYWGPTFVTDGYIIGNLSGANVFGLRDALGHLYFHCFNTAAAGLVDFIYSYNAYFYSGSRTAANAAATYRASESNAFALAASIATTQGSLVNSQLIAFGYNNAGTPTPQSAKRLAFLAIHDGLSMAETQTLYNAARALRANFGGGLAIPAWESFESYVVGNNLDGLNSYANSNSALPWNGAYVVR